MNTSTTGNGRAGGSLALLRAMSLVGAAGTAGSLARRRRGGRGPGWKGARWMSALAASLMSASSVFGQIAGEHVASGTATFQRQGSFTQITASNNAIINYRQFDVRANETVRFVQPDALSRVLNRINSNVPSRIEGQIQSNGRVYLVNPAGVFFAKGAMLNVGGIYAAAGNITDGDFLRGVNRFTTTPGARVVNEGQIHGDIVGLIGDQVFNFGAIDAPQGTVAMVSGDSVLLGERDGHVFAKVETTAEQAAERLVGPVANGAGSGSGTTQSAASSRNGRFGAGDIYGLAVWNKGTVKAKDIYVEGQRSVVKVEGTLDASNTNSGGTGGTVKVLGEYVGLYDAKVDVSGDAGGGTAMIGGNVQGKGAERTSRATYTSEGSVINADAVRSGKGGTVAVWSDEVTRTSAAISARGGSAEGDGGFIETSSKGVLSLGDAAPTLSAAKGKGGTWLIDPEDITISAAGNANITLSNPFTPVDGSGSSVLNVNTLLNAMTGNVSVIVNTQNAGNDGADAGNINVTVPIDYNGKGANALTLIANNNITIGGTISDSNAGTTDSLSVFLRADSDNSGSGAVSVNSPIDTRAGSFLSIGASFINPAGGTITSGGNVTIVANNGAITLQDSVTANTSGGGVRLSATGNISQTGGTITTDLLSARTTNGNIALQRAGNNASTVAFSTTKVGGTVSYGADADAFTVGTVSADPAITVGATTVNAGNNVAATTGIVSDGDVLLVGAGTMTIAQDINAGSTGQVRLNSTGAGITQTGGGIIGDKLGVRAAGNVLLNSTTNDVNEFAAADSGTGASIAFTDANGFAVDFVGGVGGGLFNVVNGITATDGNILLQTGAGNTGLLTVLSGININAGTGDITLTADAMALNGGADSIGGPSGALGAVTLQPVTPGRAIEIGIASGNGTSGTLSLNDAELLALRDGLTRITIGRADGTGTVDVQSSAFTDPVNILSGASGAITVNGAVNTNGNDLLIFSGGLMTLNSDINAGAGTVRLRSSSGITQPGPGLITANALGVSAADDVFLNSVANVVGTFAGINTTAGKILKFSSDGMVINSVSSLASLFPTVNGVTTTGTGGGLGDIYLDAGTGVLDIRQAITVNGTGAVRLLGGSVTQTVAGPIVADRLGIRTTGAINLSSAGAANNVGFLAASSSGSTVSYRDTNAFTVDQVSNLDSFALTSGVSAGGDALLVSGGLMTLNADINVGANAVRLNSSAGITQSTGGVTADKLGARAGGDVTLTSTTNDVNEFAATNGGTGSSISYTDANGYAVSLVGGVGGGLFNSVTGVTTTNGDIALQTGAGNTGLLTVLSGNNINAGSGNITLTADAMALNGGADSIGGPSGALGAVTLQPVTASRPIEIGLASGNGTVGTLSLNDAELLALRDGISRITIGRANGTGAVNVLSSNFTDPVNILSGGAGGTITVNGPVTTNGNDLLLFSGGTLTIDDDLNAGAGVVRLRSGSGIDQTSGIITASGLGVRSFGDVTLLSAGNLFDTFAAADSAAGSFVNVLNDITHPVTIGSVSGQGGLFTAVDGISTTSGGWIFFLGGPLTINQPIVSPGSGGIVRLTGSNITQGATGTISADTLGVRSYGGAITLDRANNVNTAGFEAPSGSSIVFRDTDGFTLGSVAQINAGSTLFELADGAQFYTGNNYGAGDGSGDVFLDAGAGPLTLAQIIDTQGLQSSGGTVRLATSGTGNDITQSGAGIIVANSLGVRAGGNVTLNLAGNDVGLIAANLGPTGSALQYRDANGFTVGSVAALSTTGTTFGLTDGITTASGDVLLQAAGALVLNNSIDSGTASTRLYSTTGGVTQGASAGGITAGTFGVNVPGAVSLLGTNAVGTFAANTATAGAGVEFRNTGVGTVTVDTVAAQGQFPSTTGVVVNNADIAINTVGSQVYAANINAGTGVGAGAIRVVSGGGISQTGGAITGIALGVRANGTVDLNQAGNDVDSFAALNTGAGSAITFRDANGLDITNVGGITSGLFNAISGITTSNGDATLNIGTVLDIANTVALGTGTALLNVNGTVDQSAAITAGALGVTALGTVNLTNAGNDVTTLSINTGIGDIRYTDATAVTLAPVGSATNALSTPDGNARIIAGGPINVGGNVVMTGAGAGIITLETLGGGVTQSTGTIVANALGADANGAINLSQAGNDVDTFAANAQFGAGHDIVFVDADDLTIGNVSSTLGSAVSGINAVGGSVLVQAGQGLAVSQDVTAATTLELRSARGVAGTGNMTFTGAGTRTLTGNTITLVSGNGLGVATTAAVDFTNSPKFLGAAGVGTSPITFILRDDANIGDAQIPTASQFGAGVNGMNYTLESMDGSVTINPVHKDDVNHTNLTLTSVTGSQILTDLTLQGLSVNGPLTTGSLDVSPGDLSFNGAITLTGPDVIFSAKEINFSSTTTITGGTNLTLRPSLPGGDMTVGLADASLDPSAALDITAAELTVLRNANLSSLTLGNATGTGTLLIVLANPLFPDTQLYNSDVTFVMNGVGGKISQSTSVQSVGKRITYVGPLQVSNDITISTVDSGNTTGGAINFTGTVDSGPAGFNKNNFALNVNSGSANAVTFGQVVGATKELRTLTATGSAINLKSVKTLNAQAYNGPIVLNSDTTLQTAGAVGDDVTFNGTINDTTAGTDALTVNAGSGAIAFNQAVGGTAALKSVTATGVTALNNISTTGNQSYTGASTIAADATLASSGGDVALLGTVDSTGGAHALTVNASTSGGKANFGGAVGTNSPLSDLNVTAALITLRSVTSTGNQSYTGSTTLADPIVNLIADAVDGGGNITFTGNVNGATLNTTDFTLNAGTGAIVFGGNVGGSTALRSLLANATTAGMTIRNITTLGQQTYNGPVTLGGTGVVTLNSSVGLGGGIKFNGDVTGTPGLSVTSNKNEIGKVTTTGTQTYNGPNTILAGDLTAGSKIDFIGAVNLGGTAGSTINIKTTGTGDVVFNEVVNGADNLVVDGASKAGNVSFLKAVGGTTALNSLQVSGKTVTIGGPTVATKNGGISIDGDVALTGASTRLTTTGGTASNIALTGTVNGASALTLDAGTGNVNIKSTVGATTPLASLTTNATTTTIAAPTSSTGTVAAGRFDFNGVTVLGDATGKVVLDAKTPPSDKSDILRFNGPLMLANNAEVKLNGGSGLFASGIDSMDATGRSLKISSTLSPNQVILVNGKPTIQIPVKLAGPIGATHKLSEFSVENTSGQTPVAASIVMAGTAPVGTISDADRNKLAYFNSDGTLFIGSTFDGLDAANVRTITADKITFDANQKLTAVGGIKLTAIGGEMALSDLNSLGNIELNAKTITFRERPTGQSVLQNPVLVKNAAGGFDLNTTQSAKDTGVDFLANGLVTFVGAPDLIGKISIATTDGKGVTYNGADAAVAKAGQVFVGSIKFATNTTNTGAQAFDRTVLLAKDGTGFTPDSFLLSGLGFDFASNVKIGSDSLASALASALASEPGSGGAGESVSLPGDLRDKLRSIDIFTRDDDEQSASNLSGRSIYMDVPTLAAPSGPLGDYAISAQRLSRGPVLKVLEAYDELGGTDQAARRERYRDVGDKIAEAWARYRDTLAPDAEPDALAFRRYVEVTPAEAPALAELNKIRIVLQRLDELGLAKLEVRVPKNTLLAEIKPQQQYDMTEVQLEEAATGTRATAVASKGN